jgi:alpha-glucosidase
MNQYLDFTFDPVRFPAADMKTFVDTLHSNGQHYVVIVDPGIHNSVGYAPYDQGLQQDLFIKKGNGEVFIGKVWPGTTAFPDWLHPNASSWWATQVAGFLGTVPIDGTLCVIFTCFA